MNVKDFGKIIPDEVVTLLKKSIYKIDTPRNYWVGIEDTPKNNLELFTFKVSTSCTPLFPGSKYADSSGGTTSEKLSEGSIRILTVMSTRR